RLPGGSPTGEPSFDTGTRPLQDGRGRLRPLTRDDERLFLLVDPNADHAEPFAAGTPRARIARYTRAVFSPSRNACISALRVLDSWARSVNAVSSARVRRT